MASIVLRKLPDDLHRKVKMIQLELDADGVKLSLEDIYIDLIKEGIKKREASNK